MPKLHLIGNAHLDPVWLWTWQDGFSEILATFRSALDRMKEFPDFKFTSACAVYYEWIEKTDPDMFEEIKRRVKEGRWSIVGGWFLQPDCNIPSGESFARHALISQRYFMEKFGVTAKTGYNVDSFGHNASLPKILRASGMENYVFMRPMPYEKELEKELFDWQSDDGSSVRTFRIQHRYNIDLNCIEFMDEIRNAAQRDGFDYMAFCGVGNHGGGPTIELLNKLKEIDNGDFVYSAPDEYFEKVRDISVPVVKEELQHHARGCYSACSSVKKSNRLCEQMLIAAEKFSVMAKELTSFEYPAKKLKKAWKNLLFNQFHDIMGGCSIKKAYDDVGYLYGEALSIAEQTIGKALQVIALNIDTLGNSTLPSRKNWTVWTNDEKGTPIVVFNPHSHTVTMPVSVYAKVKMVTDCDENEIPLQVVRGYQTNEGDKYYTAFNATVSPLGFAVYHIFLEKESKKDFGKLLTATENSLENSKIKVEFDPVTGDICSFFDKESGKYIIDKPCRAVLLDETDCDTWAHNKDMLGKVTDVFGQPEFKVTEEGNVRATLRVTVKCSNTVLCRDYSIIPDSAEVRVKTKVDFREKHKTLKFAFPAKGENIISSISYGTVRRPLYTGEEPCGMWFSSGDLCVANDSKYGYDTENGEMRMTVLRGAVYADHFGFEHRDEFCEYMDQGIHEFAYSLFPYNGNVHSEEKAEELNFGLRWLSESFHKGKLPEKMSCIEKGSDNIIITTVKQAEDGTGNIIRFFEAEGCSVDTGITLFGRRIPISCCPYQIKTFDEKGRELNLVEW